jgi:hypothetical protein
MTPREQADAAYDEWIAGDAGLAYAGDADVAQGFTDGFLIGKFGTVEVG